MVVPIFGLAGTIIVLGFLGNYLFKKTGIPDIIILLCFGLLLGPVFNVIDPSVFYGISQPFAYLALMIILFEGGLNLNIYRVIQESPKAFLMAVLGIGTCMVISMLFTMYIWGWNALNGLLLGAIIGGSSSSIVVPLVRKMSIDEKTSALLTLESTFTDAFCVIIGITILQLLTSPGGNGLYTLTHGIASAFSIGGMFGLILGILWLKVLRMMKEEVYIDIFTLSAVFLLFAGVESIGGNGAISALVFGLVLGNGIEISKIFRLKEPIQAGLMIRRFHSEISFLIRTFFFVYLGLVTMISNIFVVFFSVLLSILILLGRGLSVIITSFKDQILQKNKDIMTFMLPRGLAAAVLSQLPIAYGIANASMYPDIAFTVIMTTVLICTIGVFIVSRKLMKEAKTKQKVAKTGAET